MCFFAMEYTPFGKNIPEERLYASLAVKNALRRLRYTVDRKLFAVVTAKLGCGKSTLIRRQTGYFRKWGREKDSPNLNRNFENDQLTGYARSR